MGSGINHLAPITALLGLPHFPRHITVPFRHLVRCCGPRHVSSPRVCLQHLNLRLDQLEHTPIQHGQELSGSEGRHGSRSVFVIEKGIGNLVLQHFHVRV